MGAGWGGGQAAGSPATCPRFDHRADFRRPAKRRRPRSPRAGLVGSRTGRSSRGKRQRRGLARGQAPRPPLRPLLAALGVDGSRRQARLDHDSRSGHRCCGTNPARPGRVEPPRLRDQSDPGSFCSRRVEPPLEQPVAGDDERGGQPDGLRMEQQSRWVDDPEPGCRDPGSPDRRRGRRGTRTGREPSQPRRQRPGHPPRPRSTWWNRGQGDVDAERGTSRRVSRSGRTRAGGKGRPGRD